MQFFRQIKAMGTDFELWLDSEIERDFEGDYAEISKLLQDFEQSYSRFIPSSELCRLNEADGEFIASGEMIDILKLAQRYHHLSGGVFDPSMLVYLESYGYNASFPFVAPRELAQNQNPYESFSKLSINEKDKLVSKPANLKIDLGGIGKGFIVDKIVKLIYSKAYENFWISAGGDMFVAGRSLGGVSHKIGVQNPIDLDKELFDIRIEDKSKAIATSGIGKRNWKIGRKEYNHLIDPRSKNPVNNSLLAVSILADDVVSADVFAKIVLVLGETEGLNFINSSSRIEGFVIDKNLNISYSKNMDNYLMV